MDTKFLIIIAGVYIIGLPIFFRIIGAIQKKLFVDRKIEKLGRNVKPKDMPQPAWNTWRERLSFTMRDKRDVMIRSGENPKTINMQNRVMFLLLWLSGLVSALAGAFIGKWQLYIFSVVLFFVAISFGVKASKTILETRKKNLNKMFEIARKNLGVDADETPNSVIQVTEWADEITPKEITFQVPTTFSESGEEGFMKLFNQVFGRENAWVAKNKEVLDDKGNVKDILPGWDYDKGVLTIASVPPLPRMAPWDERYVINENIAWSFFPIGLGVENGVPIENPETGEVENIIGFDVSGLQSKLAGEKGIRIGPEITTAPMVLVGGSTGGGKAIASTEPVLVVIEEE